MKTTEDISAIDIWSIPHFLSGILIGLPLLQNHVGFWTSFCIVLALSIAFEYVEHLWKVVESMKNKITDLALGAVAFLCAQYFFTHFQIQAQNYILVFSACAYLLVVIPGWLRFTTRKKSALN